MATEYLSLPTSYEPPVLSYETRATNVNWKVLDGTTLLKDVIRGTHKVNGEAAELTLLTGKNFWIKKAKVVYSDLTYVELESSKGVPYTAKLDFFKLLKGFIVELYKAKPFGVIVPDKTCTFCMSFEICRSAI